MWSNIEIELSACHSYQLIAEIYTFNWIKESASFLELLRWKTVCETAHKVEWGRENRTTVKQKEQMWMRRRRSSRRLHSEGLADKSGRLEFFLQLMLLSRAARDEQINISDDVSSLHLISLRLAVVRFDCPVGFVCSGIVNLSASVAVVTISVGTNETEIVVRQSSRCDYISERGGLWGLCACADMFCAASGGGRAQV